MKLLNKHLANLFGKKVNERIVVFEVDDFGERNITNDNQLTQLQQLGIKPTFFVANDRMATFDELSSIYEVLDFVKDSNGNSAVFSPQTLMSNPDFEAIKERGFSEYQYKDVKSCITEHGGDKLWQLWNEGVNKRLFMPELHGREHLDVNLWMKALQNEKGLTRKAFDYNVYSLFDKDLNINHKITQAFYVDNDIDKKEKLDILQDAINIYNTTFGHAPVLFTPPASTYFIEMEKTLSDSGIKAISVSRFHNYPSGMGKKPKKKFKYMGQKTDYSGLSYSVRNCLFEPHSKNRTDWVNSCLSDIEIAFKYKRPAIISSHRINFVAQHNKANGNGLIQLKKLLKEIVKRWPDVQFLSSGELYKNW